MDVFRIVYPQYWPQLDSDMSCAKHLENFEVTFYYSKTHKVDVRNVIVQ
jgi:hypothetical protein